MTLLVKRLIMAFVALIFIGVIGVVGLAFLFGKSINLQRQLAEDQKQAHTLSGAIRAYALDHEGFLPGKDWRSEIRVYVAEGETDGFAMNEHLIGVNMVSNKDSDLTPLIFEAPPGVDVGGRQSMAPRAQHPKGYVIGFLYGHTEVVKNPNDLQWGNSKSLLLPP